MMLTIETFGGSKSRGIEAQDAQARARLSAQLEAAIREKDRPCM